jgi:hypothetical protein
MTFRRTLSSSSSSSSVAGEARAHPRRRLEDDPQESPALPDPATALLSLAAPRHLRAPLRVNRGGRVQSAAQGLPLHHLPDGREVHEVLQGDSTLQGSDDEESLLPPLSIDGDDDDDDDDVGSGGSGGELQQAINATFEVAQQAGQSGRTLGGNWHYMMSTAMNAVDVMNYNPNVPVDPEYR